MVIFQIIFSNMVILDMVIFSDIRKYGNMPYGNVFRNYYHISTSKYGKIKNLCIRLSGFVQILIFCVVKPGLFEIGGAFETIN